MKTKSYMKLVSALILATFFVGNAFSQKLTFKVKGLEDTEVHLVKYVGSKLFYADTAFLKNETVTFDGKKQDPGIMALLLPGQQYFEFIYNNEDVHIETKNVDYVENMVVKKSNENKLFLDYIRYMRDQREAAQVLRDKKVSDTTLTEEDKKLLNEQIDGYAKSVLDYQNNLVEKNPNTLVAKIVRMSTEIQIPEKPEDSDDDAFTYKYYRDHYFDNIDLTDDRLVNTPILQNKLEYFYSDKMLLQHADTIIKYIIPVVDQIPEGTLMYRFFVTTITAHFEKSKIMGMDKVWNVMIDRYYCPKDKKGNYKGYWMDSEKLDELCVETKRRLRLMIGEVAPNLILPDSTNTTWYNLHELGADYTILYFWDPNCGHCKKVTPKLGTLYEEKLKDRNVAIFSVGKATGKDFEDWKAFNKKHNLNFINVGVTDELYKKAKADPFSVIPKFTTLESLNYQETYDIYSTPRVFVLDKDSKIIAKNLSIGQIESMLDDLQGMKDAPKIFDINESDE